MLVGATPSSPVRERRRSGGEESFLFFKLEFLVGVRDAKTSNKLNILTEISFFMPPCHGDLIQ